MTALVLYDNFQEESLIPFIISFWNVHHSQMTPEQAKESLREWVQDPYRLYVITCDSQAAGFLRTHASSSTVCWIDDIYVDLPYRGKGVASNAIGMFETEMRKEGYTSFCMEVVPDNLPAMRLYHRLGYDRLSMVVMRKDSDAFKSERIETIAGLEMRVRHFD
ncbi:MAG: GNAT family N-acetyltransferase [Clostridia bacterium]|nr:GNAT family N-acetyltransferase [Clostridia bacterium]